MWNRSAVLLMVCVVAGCVTQNRGSSPLKWLTKQGVAPPPMGVGAFWPVDAPTINARNAIMIDAKTGRTLYQKNADVMGPVASLQKLLTALLVIERGRLSERVVIRKEDTSVVPAKLGLRPREAYSRVSLIAAAIVASENDAAAALGRDHSGSTKKFADVMNQKARKLGAKNTHFENATGLPARQHSTARDMARIAYHAYRNPMLRLIMAAPRYSFKFVDGRTKNLRNTNLLLRRDPIFNGMKTGFTFESGRCFISSATMNGREVILVQLGGESRYIFNDAERMMRWGLARVTPYGDSVSKSGR